MTLGVVLHVVAKSVIVRTSGSLSSDNFLIFTQTKMETRKTLILIQNVVATELLDHDLN